MDWDECCYKKVVKSINEDANLIKSLIETSEDKFKTNDRLELDEITASTKISILYDSLREILEAIAIKKGFKIYNHECFTSFLSEVCNEKSFAMDFDKFRVIRNQINYYGKTVSVYEAKRLISEIIKLIKTLTNKYLK